MIGASATFWQRSAYATFWLLAPQNEHRIVLPEFICLAIYPATQFDLDCLAVARLGDHKGLTGILCVLKTGIPWEILPCEMGCGMTCWRTRRDREQGGTWDKIHRELLSRLRGADKIDWSLTLIDGNTVLEYIVLIDGRYVAVFRLRDEPRAEGKLFVRHLTPPYGFGRVLLVSGDRETEVRYLAESAMGFKSH
jgi:hypothetical protein